MRRRTWMQLLQQAWLECLQTTLPFQRMLSVASLTILSTLSEAEALRPLQGQARPATGLPFHTQTHTAICYMHQHGLQPQ